MNTKRGFLMIGVLLLAICAPIFAYAALTPACGSDEFPCTLCDLFAFIKELTDYLVLAIAPLIAVLAFSIGGFKMLMSGANPGLRQEGIKAIRNGIIGLLIVFGAWIFTSEFLIFFVGGSGNVVSAVPWQKITCIHEQLSDVTTPPPPIPAGGAYCASNKDSITAEEIKNYPTSQNTNYVAMLDKGIGVWGTNGSCATFDKAVPPSGSKATCTSVAYLPNITKLEALRMAVDNYCLNPEPGYPCGTTAKPYMIITGGTECGHQTHGFNMSRVDLEDSLPMTNFIRGTARRAGLSVPMPSTLGNCERYTILGTTFTYEKPSCIPDIGTHWHASY